MGMEDQHYKTGYRNPFSRSAIAAQRAEPKRLADTTPHFWGMSAYVAEVAAEEMADLAETMKRNDLVRAERLGVDRGHVLRFHL